MKINNIDRCKAYNITPEWLGVLTFINSNTTKTKYIHLILDDILPKYEEELKRLDYIEFVKGGKTDGQRVRLNDKGKAFLKSIGEVPLTNTALNTWIILEKYYKKYELDNKIVNKSKTTHYIDEFLKQKESEGKNYDEKMMEAVIKAYLSTFDDKELIYTKRTLNLFYDSKNAYATKWSVEECPIYDFIEKNAKLIGNVYSKL